MCRGTFIQQAAPAACPASRLPCLALPWPAWLQPPKPCTHNPPRSLPCRPSQGHLLYYGSADAAGDWFGAQGYTLPYRVSLPDFLLDLSNGDVATDARCASLAACAVICAVCRSLPGCWWGSRVEHYNQLEGLPCRSASQPPQRRSAAGPAPPQGRRANAAVSD